MVRKFMLAMCIRALHRGDTLVDVINVRSRKFLYSVNIRTGKYSFWDCENSIIPKLVVSDLSRNDAIFELMLLGGVK